MGLYVGASLMAIFQIVDRMILSIQQKLIEARKRWIEKKKSKKGSPLETLASSIVPPIITVEYIYGDGDGKLIRTLSI